MSLGDGKDTFSFKMTNHNGALDSYWNMGDKVTIYYTTNTSTITSDHIIMRGIVTNVPGEKKGNSDFIRVEGANYTESLMSALAFYHPPSAVTVDSFLAAIVNSVAIYNDNFKVEWHSSNPTKKIDGATNFPTTEEKWNYKSVLKALEKYSGDSQTQDGNYYYYIDSDNKLVWAPKTDSIDYDFDDSTDSHTSLKTKNDTKGVVNFIIAKGGLDPAGNTITVRRDNAISRAKHGFKYKLLVSEKNQAKNLYEEDFPPNSNTSYTSASYPFTAAWGESVTSTSDYIDKFRIEIKQRLKDEADAYILEHKYGKLMTEISFSPGKGWSIGDVISTTIPSIDKVSNPMRVKESEYTNTGERFTLIEDEGTI